MEIDYDKILKQYLGGVFHFDIDSPDSALNDYLETESEEWLKIVKASCDYFLDKEMLDSEKAKFIEDYFHYDTTMNPIDWLKHISNKIDDKLKSSHN